MNVEVKLNGSLYSDLLRDLTRPHPFASERIAFASGRLASLGGQAWLVLLSRFYSIPDSDYLDDKTVGARIGPNAMTWAMQEAYRGRPAREGIFHVHLHQHDGTTGMSETDEQEIPQLIPGFKSVGPNSPHGNVILSLNHASAWIWLPLVAKPIQASMVSVIGAPIHIFEESN